MHEEFKCPASVSGNCLQLSEGYGPCIVGLCSYDLNGYVPLDEHDYASQAKAMASLDEMDDDEYS